MRFTPTQQRILDILSDGMPHHRSELHRCLNDDMSSTKVLRGHIYLLREKLLKRGENILCEYFKGSFMYRHVRLISKD